jgi:hypothetical protein
MQGYDTTAYAHSRLQETLARLRGSGKPIFILGCEGSDSDIKVRFANIPDDDDIHLTSLSEVDFDPVPLGYVNFSARATYLTRMPMRKDWRQGTRLTSMVDPAGYGPSRVPYKAIGQTIIGDFPSFNRVVETIGSRVKTPNSIAFSRNFAVKGDGALEYKGVKIIGDINLSTGGVNINDRFSWVQEELSLAMEKAA